MLLVNTDLQKKLRHLLLQPLKLTISNLYNVGLHSLDLGKSLLKQLLRHKLAMFWAEPPKFWNHLEVFWHCTAPMFLLFFVTGALWILYDDDDNDDNDDGDTAMILRI